MALNTQIVPHSTTRFGRSVKLQVKNRNSIRLVLANCMKLRSVCYSILLSIFVFSQCGSRFIPENLEPLPAGDGSGSGSNSLKVWMDVPTANQNNNRLEVVSVLNSNRMELRLSRFGLQQASAFLDLTGSGYQIHDEFVPFDFNSDEEQISLLFENNYLPDGSYTHVGLTIEAIKFALPICLVEDSTGGGGECHAQIAQVTLYLMGSISETDSYKEYDVNELNVFHEKGDMELKLADGRRFKILVSDLFENTSLPSASFNIELDQALRVVDGKFDAVDYQIEWSVERALSFIDLDEDNRIRLEIVDEPHFIEKLANVPTQQFKLLSE